MPTLKIYTQKEILSFVNKRNGETKFGEKIKCITHANDFTEELKLTTAKYVLLGIPESVGIKANNGVQGAETTFKNTLKSLLNTQNNTYNKAKKIMLLGYLDCATEMEQAKHLQVSNTAEVNKLHQLVAEIDKEVTNLIHTIVAAGKIPIIVGGGHNNAYGNIKGCSLALNKAINVLNFDAHTDFRALEGRHSGNGFSYAFKEGFLRNYFIFGLHENYTSKNIFKEIDSLNDRIAYNLREAISVRKETDFSSELKIAKHFLKDCPLGIEIDLDAVQNIASSAITPSGFSVNETRQLVSYFGKNKKITYLHICEGASDLEIQNNNQTGKLISYLIIDFIRCK